MRVCVCVCISVRVFVCVYVCTFKYRIHKIYKKKWWFSNFKVFFYFGSFSLQMFVCVYVCMSKWVGNIIIIFFLKVGCFVVVCLNLYGNFTFFCFIRCWHNDKWLVIGFCLFLILNLILDVDICLQIFLLFRIFLILIYF